MCMCVAFVFCSPLVESSILFVLVLGEVYVHRGGEGGHLRGMVSLDVVLYLLSDGYQGYRPCVLTGACFMSTLSYIHIYCKMHSTLQV